VPLAFYWKNGKVKVALGVGKGKQQFDKREDLKERESDRELKRATMQPLIVFSKPLGEMLSPTNTDEGNITAISFEQVQVLAFAVAGVLIFAETLPQLLSNIFAFLHYLIQLKEQNPFPDNGWPFNRFGYAAAMGTFLKAALGLWLFFGARGFANGWRSLRNFGTPKAPGN
jgi:hypothetical protein